jgi:ferredoxin
MAKLFFEDTREEIEIPDGSPIADACESAGVPLACSEGICGACVIDIVDGMENLTEMTPAESDFLGNASSERLACQCKIKNGRVKIKF